MIENTQRTPKRENIIKKIQKNEKREKDMTEVGIVLEQLTLTDEVVSSPVVTNKEEEIMMEVSGGPPDDEANPVEEENPTPVQEVSNVDGGQVVETSTMLVTVKKHLDDNDWKYDVVPMDDRVLIKAGMGGLNGSYAAVMDIKEERNIFVIYIKSRMNFPSRNLDKLAIFLARANYGILCGNFELDMNDGEVRYKNAINVSGSFLSEEMTETMIQVSLITMDKYFQAIVKVAYDVMSPEDAVREVEGGAGHASYLQQARESRGDNDDTPEEPVHQSAGQ